MKRFIFRSVLALHLLMIVIPVHSQFNGYVSQEDQTENPDKAFSFELATAPEDQELLHFLDLLSERELYSSTSISSYKKRLTKDNKFQWLLIKKNINKRFQKFNFLRGYAKNVTLTWGVRSNEATEYIGYHNDPFYGTEYYEKKTLSFTGKDKERLLKAIQAPIFREEDSSSHMVGHGSAKPIHLQGMMINTDKETLYVLIDELSFMISHWDGRTYRRGSRFYSPVLANVLKECITHATIENPPRFPYDYLSGKEFWKDLDENYIETSMDTDSE